MDEVNPTKAELRDLATARTSIPHGRSMSAFISAPESSYAALDSKVGAGEYQTRQVCFH